MSFVRRLVIDACYRCTDRFLEIRRCMTSPIYRKNQHARKHDLNQLRKVVGTWGRRAIPGIDEKKMFGIMSFSDIPLHVKFHGMMAKATQLKGYTPIIFTVNRPYARKCFNLFGIKHLIDWVDFIRGLDLSPDEIHRIASDLLGDNITVPRVMDLEFHGVDIGKQALSMTCRKRVEGKLDLSDKETFQLLYQQVFDAVTNVLAAEEFFDRYPLKKLLVRDSGYIPNGPIYEVALKRGIDCIIVERGVRRSSWVFKRYTVETRRRNPFSLSSETWEEIKQHKWTKDLDGKLEAEFKERYEPNSENDMRRLQAGKKIWPTSEVQRELGLDSSKKTVIVFSHVAWDACFFYGKGLFNEFEDWLYQTVAFAKDHGSQLNWIVKIHPGNVYKLQRETVDDTSEMRLLKPLFPFPDHIKIVHPDTDINTRSLFGLADYILSCQGTVGMEFPCHGVPAVIAGSGNYSGRGFTVEPRTKEAYFETLMNIDAIPPMDEQSIELARKYFYFLIRGRQLMFNDVAPMKLPSVNDAKSDVDENLELTAKSLEEFRGSDSIKMISDWLAESSKEDIIDWRQI